MTIAQKQLIGIGIVVIAVIVWVTLTTPKKQDQPLNIDAATSDIPDVPTTTAPVISDLKPKTADQIMLTKSEAYEKDKQKYTGRRIQFNDSCQAIPSQMTFKNGTAIMLDNQSNEDRIIFIGGERFNVDADDYLIMKVTSKILPNTISIDCGSLYNVGSIIIQQ